MKRNGYIDVIKFIFAIIIAEFHLGSGLFPGGRLAVEGFFMITGFLMMKSINKDKENNNIGISTVKFMFRKYLALFSTLFISVVLAFVVRASVLYSLEQVKIKLPLLIFDIIPLNTAGFRGEYIVGISWYLSSMFIALAILYPFIKKFKSNFTLTVCPLIVLLGYGILSGKYGNMAIGADFMKDSIIHTGVIRALAGCSAGCLIEEICKRISNKGFTKFAKTIFTILEVSLFAYMVYVMHNYPKSQYDYLLVGVIFAMLVIGVSGVSYSSYLWNGKYTKILGTASTLIVLNHVCWTTFIRYKLTECVKSEKILIYIALVTLSCVLVYYLSKLLCLVCRKIFNKKNWIKN